MDKSILVTTLCLSPQTEEKRNVTRYVERGKGKNNRDERPVKDAGRRGSRDEEKR